MANRIKMIDQMLVEKAHYSSQIIREIEYSWARHVQNMEKYTFKMPFEGMYNCKVNKRLVFVEGWRGTLVIDKVSDRRKTYWLINPIVCKDFTIYAIFDSNGEHKSFMANPVIGFHYLGLELEGYRKICTGDLEFNGLTNLEAVQKACLEIRKSFSICNLCSVGDVFLPKTPAERNRLLKEIVKMEDSAYYIADKLLEEGFIKPMLE